jgi:hypothetical protein
MAPVVAEGQPIRWFSYASEDIYLREGGMPGEGHDAAYSNNTQINDLVACGVSPVYHWGALASRRRGHPLATGLVARWLGPIADPANETADPTCCYIEATSQIAGGYMRHHRTKTLALAAAIVFTLGGAAVAQTTGATPGTGTTTGTTGATTTRTDDRGFNWGWLGLLGLAGLAGLTGRNRSSHNSTLNR